MKYISSILSSSIGNVLEWYDFGLFTIFSSLFGVLFFPAENKEVRMIATFGIFAVGFLCRPLGALIFGYLGDKAGRAKTLRLSILMIALPTLIIGLLPSYEQIGVTAPILLMLTRMIQGISIGGEYSGNVIYLAETAPKNYRATFVSFASTGANIGILLAAFAGIIASHLLTYEELYVFGWRLPYIFSGILCLLVYFFRLRIKETYVFEYLKQKQLLAKNPVKTVFKHNLPHFLRSLGVVCAGTTFYFFNFVFLPLFLSQYADYPVRQISLLMSCLIALMIVLIPLAGLICDRVGRRKMLLFNSMTIMMLVVPGFYFLQSNYFSVLVAILLLYTMISALEQGTTCISLVENFPAPARYTGLALSYSIGNGILGGTVPIICQWLFIHTTLFIAPAIYIAGCAAITAIVVYFFVPETSHETLIKIDGLSSMEDEVIGEDAWSHATQQSLG